MIGIFYNIIDYLNSQKIKYEIIKHEPVLTSEEARDKLGHKPEEGAKSLIMKSNNKFVIITVSEPEKINFKFIKEILADKKIKMADFNEIKEKYDIENGAVSPFGFPDAILIVSKVLFDQESVYVNPGKNNVTIKLAGHDFKKIMVDCKAIII